MRVLLPLAVAAVLSVLAPAAAFADDDAPACLSESELRHLVNSGAVVPQIYAFRTARSHIGGDVISASLCPKEAGFVYNITTLTKDGKLARIQIDAVTGKPTDSQ
jgi:uncharacterized membrane protein YkoI